MSTIGILGGGQLGLMMAHIAKRHQHQIVVLDPDPNCPCSSIADNFICAAYNDEQAFNDFVSQCDVCTYEFENADVNLVSKYESKFPQGSLALKISQHRFLEKNFAKKIGLITPNYILIESELDLKKIVKFPTLIKTCRFGYDGKGQWLIDSLDDLNQMQLEFPNEYIAESYIDFTHEISVVVARSSDKNVYFPPFENTHHRGILKQSQCPADVSESIRKQAIDAAKAIIENLNYVGVLAVEFFVNKDQLIFNEFAPRPHNSAHLTIDCFDQSQFDVHIAAITKQSLKQPLMIYEGIMRNILGQDMEGVKAFIKNHPHSQVHFHDYGKQENRFNRKVGHITATIKDATILESIFKQGD
jgi:5-(carboxyamino)imidazole ribonucleotide synthase